MGIRVRGNPPNLSRLLVRLRRMRLGVSGVSGPRTAGNVPRPTARERDHSVMHAIRNTARDQQHGADAALEQLARHRTVDLSCHASHQCMKRARGHRHRPIEQRGQIVRQHLDGHIHRQGMLAQPAHTL